MRKSWLIPGLILLAVLVLASAATALLANSAPYHPGDGLYAVQSWAEHAVQPLKGNAANQAAYGLDLLERRLADLNAAQTPDRQTAALAAFNLELDRTLAAFQPVTADPGDALRDRLVEVFRGLGKRMPDLILSVVVEEVDYTALHAKVAFLKMLALETDWPLADIGKAAGLSTPIGEDTAPSAARKLVKITLPPPDSVLFPDGTRFIRHTDLTGFHAEMTCQSCHGGTPQMVVVPDDQCLVCHSQRRPANHYEGRCSLCHIPQAWTPAQFDHPAALIANCQSCHAAAVPANHYVGQCSACHQPGAWLPAAFNHPAELAADCWSCHALTAPADHYKLQCSTCHQTSAWIPAAFDHQGIDVSNCQVCHAKNAPANHYAAQCSTCHSTNAWLPSTFSHAAVNTTDCQSCHAQNKPANHYNAQCSACHNTNAWLPASFNHSAANATDCQSCHAQNKPANHYNAQCSACHNTNAWLPASFNHSAAGATNCSNCHAGDRPSGHYDAQCSSCHNTSAWQPASFNHGAVGATNCSSCHAGDRPANHFDQQCSTCHDTSGWLPAHFNHSFPLNHGGANGQCSTCHPSGGSQFTCFGCHNKSELTKKHNEEGISNFASRCMDCHADGRKHDD